jgi:hypothetical protein
VLGTLPGAVFAPPGVDAPALAPGPVGDAPADGVVDAEPLGPELADAALLGPPAVSVPEPLGEMPGRAPDALALPLPLLAPPASEGVRDVEPVLGDGPAFVVVLWEPWTA